MAAASGADGLHSALLSIPTELRCQIYDYLLVDSQAITVSAAYMTVYGNRIQDRARKQVIPGLPLDLTPIVRHTRDASLLSVTNPAQVAIDSKCMASMEHGSSTLGMPAPLALLLTCHLVKDELTDYMRGKKKIKAVRAQSVASGAGADADNAVAEDDDEGLSLYVTYPYGVLILKSLYPYLLKQARRVYLSGYYTSPKTVEPGSPTASSDESSDERLTPTSSFAIASSSFTTAPPAPGQSLLNRSMISNKRRRTSADNTARTRLRLDMPTPRQQRRATDVELAFPLYSDVTCALATSALTTMIRTLFPPEGTQQCTKLSSRILYPGQNAYSFVWADKHSPITHILRNVCGGKFDMRVQRSDPGVGLYTTVRPKPDGRIVSTSWENWRAEQAGRGRVGISELDAFLRAHGEDKVV
ncbi:hypothetical protein DE146DRAFT_243003 [Phaeosphaeria sp. MPI-PUGE-AT-0046c]|nr:hypothetical protein DE146DRAFT_243003 [Phaeosphaeria sp. MPI-PUGE-AT-0046c]